MTTEELIHEEKVLLENLSKNRAEQRAINKAEYLKKHSVNIGDTVDWMDGKPMKVVITRVEYSGVNPSCLFATLFKSDGTLGIRETRIWWHSINSLKKVSA